MNITKVVSVTPTLTVHDAYASGDFVGTSGAPMEFANIIGPQGSAFGIAATLIDGGANAVACELWLFDSTVTPPDDSAAWTISDADAKKCIGVIPFSTFYASALNTISNGDQKLLGVQVAGGTSSLFGCLVTRGAPTYADGNITIRLAIGQD